MYPTKLYARRVGVFAVDTGSGAQLAYRAVERFVMCSTFKVLATAAILRKRTTEPGLLNRLVRYDRSEIVVNSPIAEQHVADRMTVSALCADVITYSDNTAGNQLLKILGGPAEVTAFARSLGDKVSRLDRWEPELNAGNRLVSCQHHRCQPDPGWEPTLPSQITTYSHRPH